GRTAKTENSPQSGRPRWSIIWVPKVQPLPFTTESVGCGALPSGANRHGGGKRDMSKFKQKRRAWGLCGAGLLAWVSLTGCQCSAGGEPLPSPYYIYDDVQYFPAGHEFLLQNEADYLSSQNAPPPPPPGAEMGARPGAQPVRR